MPIMRQQVAKASGFQNNCGLNGLTHKFMTCLARNQVHNPDHTVNTVLRQRFNAYYGCDLSPEEFRAALSQINNDYHREIILAPVLRTMLLMDEVVAPMRQILGEDFFRDNFGDVSIQYPGTQLEDVHLIPLANFFGLKVESYLRQNLNPTQTNVIEQIPEINRAQNQILARKHPDAKEAADIPALKLWRQGGAHWEYEEESVAAKDAHNQFYDRNHPDFYQYGYPNGEQNLLGAPDAQNIRRRMNQALNPAGGAAKNLNLSQLLQQYAREQRRAGLFAHANPFTNTNPFATRQQQAGQHNDMGMGANYNHNHYNQNSHDSAYNDNNQVPAANPLAAFSNILKGGMLSDMGNKILAALIAPFKEDNTPAVQDSGKPKSLLETLMQGVITAHSIIMKLASAFVGLKPVIDEIQTKVNRQQNPAADLQVSELGQHPEASIFAEYVKLLPVNTKARLNSLWLDPALSKNAVMNQLGEALMEAGLQDELEFFNFKRKANQLLNHNPTLHRHLIRRWDEQVYARSQVQPETEAARIRDNHKKELLEQLDSIPQKQNKSIQEVQEESDLVERAKAALGASRTASADGSADGTNRRSPKPLEDEDPKVLREMQRIRANALKAGIPFHHPNAHKINPAGLPVASVANPSWTPGFDRTRAAGIAPRQMPRGMLRNPAGRSVDDIDLERQRIRESAVRAGIPLRHPNAGNMNPAGLPGTAMGVSANVAAGAYKPKKRVTFAADH